MVRVKDERKKGVPGRRTQDRRMAKELKETKGVLTEHLTECADARKEANRTLAGIQRHLKRQDRDLRGIRTAQRAWATVRTIGGWAMSLALICLEAYRDYHEVMH